MDVSRRATRELKFKPGVDLFASDYHHQLSSNFTAEHDQKAAGTDAFTVNWLMKLKPYINPPWYLIPRCLEKIQAGQAEVMMVVHKWEHCSWWPVFTSLCVRFMYLNEATYLRP